MEMKHLFLLGVLAVGLAGCTTVSRQVDPQTGEVTTQTKTFVPLPVPIVVPRRVEPQPYYPQQPYYVPPPRRHCFYDRWRRLQCNYYN